MPLCVVEDALVDEDSDSREQDGRRLAAALGTKGEVVRASTRGRTCKLTRVQHDTATRGSEGDEGRRRTVRHTDGRRRRAPPLPAGVLTFLQQPSLLSGSALTAQVSNSTGESRMPVRATSPSGRPSQDDSTSLFSRARGQARLARRRRATTQAGHRGRGTGQEGKETRWRAPVTSRCRPRRPARARRERRGQRGVGERFTHGLMVDAPS